VNSKVMSENTKKGSGPPKKESILELQKLMDTTVRVKCVGGREMKGILKGYDELVNLVLDECDEFLRGTSCYRSLGLFQVVPLSPDKA
jgi:small nuclear ribonucleoprotein (snRNP)-like protein